MPFRAFVGVPVPSDPALVRLLDGLDALGADLKVVAPDHLHVTLSFLGNVPDDAPAALAEALDEAARATPPFDATLDGVGAFPSARRPRVVWAGSKDAAPLTGLSTRVRDALSARGYRGDDKDFRAHVTLGRVKGERGHERLVAFLREHGRDALPTVPVRVVNLYRSRLGAGGPTYDVLHEARLGAA